jgi:DNA repair exonuclease SbcCD ATPase subunit
VRLKKVLLENVCQFSRLEHTFHPGLTGIVGPNGSGKSNLVKAVYFALTGDFRNAGVKAANVAQLGEGKRSAVTLWLEHEGVDVEVVRGLAGARTSLKVDERPELVLGDLAVTSAIMEILDTDAKLLGEHVFVPQLQMTDFINAGPADRARTYQRLFGTDECEAVHAFVTRVLDRELALAEVPDLDAVRGRISANGGRMHAAIARLDRLDEDIEVAAAREKTSRAIIARDDRVTVLAGEIAATHAKLRGLTEQCNAQTVARKQEAESLETLEAALHESSSDAEAAKLTLATWRAVEARRARAAVLAKRRARLEADIRPPPDPPAESSIPVDAFGREGGREALSARKAWLTGYIATFAAGKAECPTCGQPVPRLDRTLADYRAELADVEVRHAAADAELQAYWAYHEQSRAYEVWREKHLRDMADLVVDEDALGAEPDDGDEVDAGTLQAIVDVVNDLRRDIIRVGKRHEVAVAAEAHLSGQCDQLLVHHNSLSAEAAEITVPAEVVVRARDQIAELESLRAERERALGEAEELARTLDSDEDMARRYAATATRNETVQALRAGAEQVLAVTHRNAAPRLVSEARLAAMIGDVDDHLEMFDSDFSVRPGQDLSFVADFADGRSQAGDRLSPGQQGVLALAFWVAVNSLYAGKIGFLSLDEPTASLDRQNLGALEIALRRLRELSESEGLQCLLVTHEPSFAPLFDDVLQL